MDAQALLGYHTASKSKKSEANCRGRQEDLGLSAHVTANQHTESSLKSPSKQARVTYQQQQQRNEIIQAWMDPHKSSKTEQEEDGNARSKLLLEEISVCWVLPPSPAVRSPAARSNKSGERGSRLFRLQNGVVIDHSINAIQLAFGWAFSPSYQYRTRTAQYDDNRPISPYTLPFLPQGGRRRRPTESWFISELQRGRRPCQGLDAVRGVGQGSRRRQ